MSEEKKALVITGLAELFNRQLTEGALRLYLSAIQDVPAHLIERAAAIAATTCKFFPVPAELRALCGAQAETSEESSLIAWDTFSRAANDIGSYRTVTFTDKTINAVVRSLGGWPELLARSPEEFDKWVRKDFLATYQTYAKRRLSDEAYAPLGGLSQSGVVNAINGAVLEYEPTVERVGIPERKQERLTCQTSN